MVTQKGQLQLRTVPLIPLHDLRTIRGTFAQVTDKAFYQDTATEDYLEVVLTDEEDVPEAVGKLQVIYPNLMGLKYDNTRTRATQLIDGAEAVEQKSQLQLFSELYELQNNQPMSQQQAEFVSQLIEEIWGETV